MIEFMLTFSAGLAIGGFLCALTVALIAAIVERL